MSKEITIEAGSAWITTSEAATLLKRSARVVQQWGKEGKLKRRPHPDNPRVGAYDRAEVERLAEITQQASRTQHTPADKTALALRFPKSSRGEVALAVPPILTDLLERQSQTQTALLKQLELQATTAAETLKNVVAQIFAERQAERDADRYRFDAERADRAERLARKTRDAVPVGGKVNGKAKAARA